MRSSRMRELPKGRLRKTDFAYMKKALFLLCTLILSAVITACGSLSAHIAENRKNLQRIEYGMTKAQVRELMGTESIRNYNNPYRTTMQRQGDKLIEVDYYWTDGTRDFGVEDHELSPVVFEDGKVVGVGREFWTEFVSKYEIRVR